MTNVSTKRYKISSQVAIDLRFGICTCKCKTCDKYIDQPSKSRPVPEPNLLQQFLTSNTEFRGTLNRDDRVCCVCYQSHLVTVKHIKQTVESTDSDLRDLISTIKCSLPTLNTIRNFETALDHVVRQISITVGESLLSQTALLLPQVHIFREKMLKLAAQQEIPIQQDLPGHSWLSWLRSKLCSLLDKHIAYRCSVLKHGTVLYRYGGDIIISCA